MNREIAQKLMTELEGLNQVTNRQADLIEMIADMDERRKFRRAIITVIGDVHAQLMFPVLRQFPDLEPDLE